MKKEKSFFLWLFFFIFLTTYSFNSVQKTTNSLLPIKKIEIETGVRNMGNIEVLSGLSKDDKIIAEGLTKIRPGMKVKPIIKSQ